MIERSDINAYVRRLAQEFHPELVILFGSYAHGRPTNDSDVDLLVIMNHGKKNVEQAIDIDRRIEYSFPLDLLVRTPAEIEKRIALRDVFMLSILKQGRVMYERRRPGMVGEGRRRLRNGHAGISSPKIA
jgi:predicted nucleotidyltransferase